MIEYIKRDYKNILTNIAAIIVFAETVYPGLNVDMIMKSISEGTFIQAAMNVAFCYILASYGKNNEDRY
jgi:hypothetical protein